MQAGKLRHRITFDEPVTTQGDNGEELVNFVAAFTVWGSIEPLTGRERLFANQISAETDTRIRIRWSPLADTINAKWRARFHTTIYNLTSIGNKEMRRRELEIMATSGVNNG